MSVKALHVKTTHDTNGNPRRLWVFMEGKETWAQVEGYGGEHALRRERGEYLREPMDMALEITVSPSEFRRLRKLYA